MKKKKVNEIKDYDKMDTSQIIDRENPKKLEDIGIELPEEEPTKVVSIRLPSKLLNQLKAYASDRDINYSALIKMILSDSMESKNSSFLR
ncbi:MAG: BrnA antitoxin family protein [Melioribacteraceae bacterium]|nr:BrnA antitoxin family protein [Melioribacteraceae bacterium]MCF8356317.1 BrnA antitoxin family protein [Melioribacteraceae bacterium]MCF8394369.1 BrnA antitoxin family protein [Melioribacteraceae bacterium]MCF8420079.1 BrnA antitoxin family protein [Melioribacteraceae bacterium]